jgi:glycosyltransferase involved in cell wall biosynthesis
MGSANDACGVARRDGITIAVPVHNEEATVESVLDSLAAQSVGADALEVLVYDGMSDDRTAEICRRFADRAPWRRFEVHTNENRTVPFALNAALAESRCRWFTRADGRVRFSERYVESCIAMLLPDEPMVAAAGLWTAEGTRPLDWSIAAALTHPLGVGRGYRTIRSEAQVDHHPFALWRTEDVRAVGGYDERLTRNQDDEFSSRAAQRGAQIHLSADAAVCYRPRDNLSGLAGQYFQYGLWKSVVARDHGGYFPVRSLAPVALALLVVAASALATGRRRALPLAGTTVGYAAAGALAARGNAEARAPHTAAALATLQAAYGAGVLIGWCMPTLARTPIGQARLRGGA